MANEVLKKIQEAEKEADEIISSAHESAKRILKDMELKIKSDNAVNILLKEEEGYINNILNIDEAKIDEVVKLLTERIVR